MRCWIFRPESNRTDEHVAVAVSELRAETRLAALEEHIKAPRPCGVVSQRIYAG